ncbi:hypothetical protein QYE76_029223 [Lolium multiflorum]|uniref:Uncharacterized protein n=1 Tax=Lolium multiflorum TaxID=4521 RepID=A0AAD8QMD9_LOLMU|nr:hypothetical protein QYE76_029223 [Lolium multiflorum]
MQRQARDTSRRLESNPENCISTAQKDAIASQNRDGASCTGSTERRRKVREHPNPIPVTSDSTPRNPAKGKDPMYTGRDKYRVPSPPPRAASSATSSTSSPAGNTEAPWASGINIRDNMPPLGTGAGSNRNHAEEPRPRAEPRRNQEREPEPREKPSRAQTKEEPEQARTEPRRPERRRRPPPRGRATEAGASPGNHAESPRRKIILQAPSHLLRHHPWRRRWRRGRGRRSRSRSRSPGGGPRDARERLNEYRSDYIGPSDLEENTIFCWLDLKKAFENHFRGTYKRPATTSDLQACIQKKGETSELPHPMVGNRNECSVDNRTTMHAFIGGLQRGGCCATSLPGEREQAHS